MFLFLLFDGNKMWPPFAPHHKLFDNDTTTYSNYHSGRERSEQAGPAIAYLERLNDNHDEQVGQDELHDAARSGARAIIGVATPGKRAS